MPNWLVIPRLGGPGFLSYLVHEPHHTGDWGELGADDLAAKDVAVVTGERLRSSYAIGKAIFWIITEADWSVSTVLLSNDY